MEDPSRTLPDTGESGETYDVEIDTIVRLIWARPTLRLEAGLLSD